ncbi:MAG TPA: hypothetical protein VMT57_03135 [Candidatus Thermoplasmatota archaeon]|nr:hypothetical protein [Candidatus Thermoplasmatota archaeon]
MKIKSRNAILSDIIREGKQHPDGWSATFGNDSGTFSHDCYMFHPNVGIYLIKEYDKNPYEVKGVGSKIARRVDDDIMDRLTEQSGDFGILQGNLQRILANLNKGIPPRKILEGAIQGEDLGLRIPVRGHASTSKETYEYLDSSFAPTQKRLSRTFEKIVADDGLYSSYD